MSLENSKTISRREFLKIGMAGITGFFLISCGVDFSTGDKSNESLKPLEPNPNEPGRILSIAKAERAAVEGIPQEVVTFIKESEAKGRIPAHHGTVAWSLISSEVLRELGYPEEVVDAFRGLKSFRNVSETFPGGIFNRHYLKVPSYLNNNNSYWNELWVATQRPGSDAPIGTGYLFAQDYANSMMSRAWNFKIAIKVTKYLEEEVKKLDPLVRGGQATTEQVVLYDSLSWQLEFNKQRLELWEKIQGNYRGGALKAIKQSMRTPVVVQYDFEPREIVYNTINPQNPAGFIFSGEIPHSKINAIYYPSGINTKTLNLLKEMYPNVKFIKDVSITTENVFTRMPQSIYNTMWRVGEAGQTVINYLPLIGIVVLGVTPSGMAVYDLAETHADWLEAQEKKTTNMSLPEFYDYKSQLFNMLVASGDDSGNLFWPLIDYLEATKEPNQWQGVILQKDVFVENEIVIPKGTKFMDILNVNGNFILGKAIASAPAEVTEDFIVGRYSFVYRGIRVDTGLPAIEIYDEDGGKIEPTNLEGIGPFIGVGVGSESEEWGRSGTSGNPVYLAGAMIRYINLEPDKVKLVLKSKVVDINPNS